MNRSNKVAECTILDKMDSLLGLIGLSHWGCPLFHMLIAI